MALVEKPKQVHTVYARGRKLKGYNSGIFFTLPLKVAKNLGIQKGDLMEIEIRKITRTEIRSKDGEVYLNVTERSNVDPLLAHTPARTREDEQTHTALDETERGVSK